MKRYINANALIQDIERSRANNEHNNAIASQTHNAEHRHFIKMVLDQPTADVVEVVRCKDCIYSFMSITGETVLYCDMYPSDDHLGWDKDHYCGCGERKDS